MPIDPRTLKEVEEPADCHLIPDWCGMSNMTVPLEKKIDNDLGRACDIELKKYLNNMLGKHLPGKVSMARGAKSLSATYDVVAGELAVYPPKKGDSSQFLERALGAKEGEAEVHTFTGEPADGHLAGVSAIHSALLVLHRFGRPEIMGASFDSARELIVAAIAGKLSDEQRALIDAMVKFNFVTSAKAPVEAGPKLSDLRTLYNEDLDASDGVDVDFPNKSLQETDDSLIVTLPYSKNIRAMVMFSK
jgi:hypothetical protein